jgi:Na+-driven multidrug efflux pump
VTGSTPVINAAINRLPGRDHEIDLAAFAVFLSTIIVLHSPLFVAREIAIKLSLDRAGSRRAMLFCVSAGAVVSLFEIVLGWTPLGAWVVGHFSDRPEIVESAHRAFRLIWPVPMLIAVRGVYQAHQIRADDTLFVGLGTLVRLGFTAVLGFAIAPRIGIDGATLGAICVTAGLVVEAAFTMWRSRAKARPPETAEGERLNPLRFGLPLMFANFLGVGASLLFLYIAGLVPAAVQDSSLAAYQEVRPLHWLFCAGAFALQSLVTAKVRAPEDERWMLQFGLIVGAALTVLLSLVAFTPLRLVVLVDLLGEDPNGRVLKFATPALQIAAGLPILVALRFTVRGTLIARGKTRAITVFNIILIGLMLLTIAAGWLPDPENGAFNAYVLWVVFLAIEIAVLSAVAFRGGWGGRRAPPVRPAREALIG